MRSASWIVLTGAAAVLAGCATTQQTAARLRLNDARIRASELPTRVHLRDPAVQITGVSVVTGATGSAMIVRVRNLATVPVSDLPIAVAVIYRHRELDLNGESGLAYFQTHLPVIAAGGTLTWVFTTARRLQARARPSVSVGLPSAPPPSIPRTLPELAAHLTPGSGALRGGVVGVSVQNRSALSQYQLPVYVTASRGGHYVAAGDASVAVLDSGAAAQVELRLAGSAKGARISIQTPPTIFN